MSPDHSATALARMAISALPEPFRSDYGPDIESLFRARWRDAAGLPPAPAVIRRLGLVADLWIAVIRERAAGARTRRSPSMQALWMDLKHTVRWLARSPGFAATALATLALGIGATTARSAPRSAVGTGRSGSSSPPSGAGHGVAGRRGAGGQEFSPALVGAAVGLAVAVALSRLITTVLYQVSPNDPTILMAAATLLPLVALLAAAVPAHRAARLDPLKAMQE